MVSSTNEQFQFPGQASQEVSEAPAAPVSLEAPSDLIELNQGITTITSKVIDMRSFKLDSHINLTEAA